MLPWPPWFLPAFATAWLPFGQQPMLPAWLVPGAAQRDRLAWIADTFLILPDPHAWITETFLPRRDPHGWIAETFLPQSEPQPWAVDWTGLNRAVMDGFTSR